MKRIFITALIAVAAASTYAQTTATFTVIDPGYGNYFLATAMSQNGKYVAGWEGSGVGSALYEVATGNYYSYSYASEMSAVTDNGMMVGYGESENGLLGYNPLTSETIVDSSADGMLWGKACTPDGTIIAGATYNNATWMGTACYWQEGVRHALPQPDAKEIGFGDAEYDEWEYSETIAVGISADGSIIVGNVWDWYLDAGALIWTRDDNGDYVLNAICAGLVQTDWGYDKPYYRYEATAISANGKYIAMYLQDVVVGGYSGGTTYMGRYDVETGELETASYSNGNCTATRIANDGTIVGYTGDQDSQSRTALIWEPGSDIMLLADRYPEITALAEWDEDQNYNFCADITPDGRYICGGGWHYFEEDGESAYARYASWVLDRGEEYSTGINSATTFAPSEDNTTRYYSLDGRALAAPQKGLNIVKSNGTTVKTIIR